MRCSYNSKKECISDFLFNGFLYVISILGPTIVALTLATNEIKSFCEGDKILCNKYIGQNPALPGNQLINDIKDKGSLMFIVAAFRRSLRQ